MRGRKEFGLRSEMDMPRNSFIYEYVGGVVKKQMGECGEEAIHRTPRSNFPLLASNAYSCDCIGISLVP
jgi:hypothetical protein